jgi:uncharacterized protein (DUF58 family)
LQRNVRPTRRRPNILQRVRVLVHRRVRSRVTRGGALFTLALLLTGAGAFLSANNLLFLVFSAMVALVLVSGFLSRLVLSGLELELLLPEHVSARVPTPARVRLRNLKHLTPSFSIELAGRRDPVTATPSILTGPLYFPLIPGRAVIEAAIHVYFPRRGRHRENLFVISTRFPFGFLRRTTMVSLRRETIVYPSLEAQTDSGLLLEAITGEIESQLRGAGLDFYRIRPYETTDSALLVDWKSTAHTGSLQVREFSREQQPMVEIYLDRRIAPGQNEWFENAVERCAFLAWHLGERDISVWLRSQRFACAIPEEGEVYDVLKYLALVEPIMVEPIMVEPINAESTAGRRRDHPAEPPLDPSSVRIVFSVQPEEFENQGWISTSARG